MIIQTLKLILAYPRMNGEEMKSPSYTNISKEVKHTRLATLCFEHVKRFTKRLRSFLIKEMIIFWDFYI